MKNSIGLKSSYARSNFKKKKKKKKNCMELEFLELEFHLNCMKLIETKKLHENARYRALKRRYRALKCHYRAP